MITSVQNQLVKHTRGLHRKKEREASGQLLLEGIRLIEEALNAGAVFKFVLFDALHTNGRGASRDRFSTLVERLQLQGVQCEETTDRVLDACSDTETSQGIIAVCEQPVTHDLDSFLSKMQTVGEQLPLVVALDGLQDPGNLGTIIRTSCAAGVLGIVIGSGSVDPFSPKAIRGSMGMFFKLPIYTGDLGTFLEASKKLGYHVLAATGDGKDYYVCTLNKPSVLVIGNEGAGISEQTSQLADERVSIPMVRDVESLNAAVACSILVYDAARQFTCRG